MIGQRIVDGVDIGIGEQFLVGSVSLRDAQFARGGLRASEVARGDAGDLAVSAVLHGWDHAVDRDAGGAQDAPTDLLHKDKNTEFRIRNSEWRRCVRHGSAVLITFAYKRPRYSEVDVACTGVHGIAYA